MYPSFPFLPSRGCCIANLTKYRQLKVTKLIMEVVQASLATVGSPMVITAFGCTVDSVYGTQLRTQGLITAHRRTLHEVVQNFGLIIVNIAHNFMLKNVSFF